MRGATRAVWVVGALALVVVSLETGLRLGANSPDTRFTLPRYSLGYFWDTPLGWTSVIGGVPVNRDSLQFSSLAGFLRDEPAVVVPPGDNVYVRFAGYALVGSVLAPLVGAYASFVIVNVLFWVAAAMATYVLAVRFAREHLVAVLAALLVSTAPAFEALAGQALPYVASYSLFVLGLLLFDHMRLFERTTSASTALACGLVGGIGFLFYDLYMLPAFVVVYGVFRRMPLRNMILVVAAMTVPRLTWSLYWQAAQLGSYSQNETHPAEALAAWFDSARTGEGLSKIKGYALLAGHGALNVGAAFLFWPVLLAVWELWCRRRSAEAAWFVAVAVAGFAPALFMLSTWPHIPRWYAYGFPAVYILTAAAAVRIARWLLRADRPLLLARWLVRTDRPAPVVPSLMRTERPVNLAFVGLAVLVVLPAVVLANLDLVGSTRPMELVLFQPTHWSYLWSP